MELDTILDRIVEDILKDAPEKSDLEASFMALHLNITVLVNSLAQVGMNGEGLTNEQMFAMCSGLVETCTWMAGKEMAMDTMRDIENGL